MWVRFAETSPRIHTMCVWNFAYRAARQSPWEEAARDRERFKQRIRATSKIINPVLIEKYNNYVMNNVNK